MGSPMLGGSPNPQEPDPGELGATSSPQALGSPPQVYSKSFAPLRTAEFGPSSSPCFGGFAARGCLQQLNSPRFSQLGVLFVLGGSGGDC